jgi:hypothetical protein
MLTGFSAILTNRENVLYHHMLALRDAEYAARDKTKLNSVEYNICSHRAEAIVNCIRLIEGDPYLSKPSVLNNVA